MTDMKMTDQTAGHERLNSLPVALDALLVWTGVMVLSHWPHVAELVAELVSSVNGSIEKHGHIVRHIDAISFRQTCLRLLNCAVL